MAIKITRSLYQNDSTKPGNTLFLQEVVLPFVECFNVEMRSSPVRNKDIHGNISDEIKRSLHSSHGAQGNVFGKYDAFGEYMKTTKNTTIVSRNRNIHFYTGDVQRCTYNFINNRKFLYISSGCTCVNIKHRIKIKAFQIFVACLAILRTEISALIVWQCKLCTACTFHVKVAFVLYRKRHDNPKYVCTLFKNCYSFATTLVQRQSMRIYEYANIREPRQNTMAIKYF